MKEIKISCAARLVAKVDDSDHVEISKHNWFITGNGYAYRWLPRNGAKNRRAVLMHRDIMKPPLGMEIDHIDGNKLNNCRDNLEVVTRSQNQQRESARRTKAGARGVKRSKKKWVARISINKITKHLGSFVSKEDAAKAYDAAAIAIYGPNARINGNTV